MRPRSHATASHCDRQRARDFERARAFANVDAGHAAARAKSVKALPFRLRRDLLRDWAAESVGGPAKWNAATRRLNRRAEYITGRAAEVGAAANVARIAARDDLHAWSGDEAVKAWARRRAGECGAIVGGLDEWEAFAAARDYASRWRVGEARLRLPAEPGEGKPLAPYVARLTCAKWWRRAARVMLGRGIEVAEIDRGGVHSHAGRYLSDRNAERAQLAAKRNAQLLLDMDAENELGERVNLATLAKGSIANPWVRFSEMMVTIKGLDLLAREGGFVGRFITWTLPSRYHARLDASGQPNPKYEGLRPREGQAALCGLWARLRSRVHRWGVRIFGLRVAEPHHDGTPHWHLMLWMRPQHAQRVCDALRSLALEESPDEDGAQLRRCQIEEIDERGAAGYLAKYISKATVAAGISAVTEKCADGQVRAVDDQKPSRVAQRARWWASLHGIRQFQFYGVPPRGLWREVRRVREPLTADDMPGATPEQLGLFELVRSTADASDYAGHVRALGGIEVPPDLLPVRLLKREVIELNAYGEARADQVFGLHMPSSIRCRVVTREHVWTLKPARSVEVIQGLAERPWTRVNNCTGPVPPDPFSDSPPDPGADSPPDWWGDEPPGDQFEAPRC